jgi:glucosamine--fructose-6-phosphate aminotransferase (isomerizing)
MYMAEDILAQPAAFRKLIADGPAAWAAALAPLGDRSRFRRIILTGMGSSYFAAMAGAFALNRFGFPAAAELTSTLLYYGASRIADCDLLIACSQSGGTIEVVKLLTELGAKNRPPVIAVTNQPGSAVAGLADVVMATNVPPDHGVAVKTYGATTLTLLWLAMRLAGRPDAEWSAEATKAAAAVEQVNQSAEAWRRQGHELLGVPAAAVLGRGPSLSAAWAGALLFNEVAKAPAWAEDGGEFRHGVWEAVSPGFLACVLNAHGPAEALGRSLAAELTDFGARVLTFTPAPHQDELFVPLVQVVPFQWLSLGWAEAQSITPGSFRHTAPVTTSEGKEVTR